MRSPPSFATAILLAGGAGMRLSDVASDKVLLSICGKPVFQYSLEAFADSKSVHSIVIVYRDEEQRRAIELLVPIERFSNVSWIQGGLQRQDSVWAGLSRLSADCDVVLIHDGARPLITPTAIDAVSQAVRKNQVACIARKTADTIKEVRTAGTGYLLRTIDRSHIWAMETPQGFKTSLIREGYRDTIENDHVITDDLSAIEAKEIPVTLIEMNEPNPKLTTPQDIAYLEFLLQNRSR